MALCPVAVAGRLNRPCPLFPRKLPRLPPNVAFAAGQDLTSRLSKDADRPLRDLSQRPATRLQKRTR